MMASLSSSSPGKPLRLKDFLEEDPNSDSYGGAFGFRTVPRRLPDQTVRFLLATELRESAGGDRPLRRSRSKGALTKITAVINAVKMLPFASPSSTGCGHSCQKPLPRQGGFLSRSFSGKLRRSFWRKREKGGHRAESNNAVRTIVRVKDIVRLRSFGGDDRRAIESAEKTQPRTPPSPVRSTHSGSTSSSGGGRAWSDTDSAGSDSFSCRSSVCCGEDKDGSPNMDAKHGAISRGPYVARGIDQDSVSKSTCQREPKVKEEGTEAGGKETVVGCPCHFEEEKDQLSPVSVMDFPFEDDDNDEDEGVDDVGTERTAATPTPFHRSLANLERTKHQLLQKIREFESLAALVDPVDQDSRFVSSEDETEPDRAVHEADDDTDEAYDQLLQFQVEVEERAFALLRELKRRGGGASPGKKAAPGGGVDELLVDFFIERLSCPRRDDASVHTRTKRRLDRTAEEEGEEGEEEALLRAAEDWIGGRRRAEAARGWRTELREMEIDGRWRCGHVGEEEQEEIAADLGGHMLDELLVDLFLS